MCRAQVVDLHGVEVLGWLVMSDASMSDEEMEQPDDSGDSVSDVGVRIPPPAQWCVTGSSRKKTELTGAAREIYEKVLPLYRRCKLYESKWCVMLRQRRDRRAARVWRLEHSVRGDLEVAANRFLCASWVSYSAEEVLDRIEFLRNVAPGLTQLKVNLHKHSRKSRGGMNSMLQDARFWKKTAREMGVYLGGRDAFNAVRAHVRRVLWRVDSQAAGTFVEMLQQFRVRRFVEHCQSEGLC